MRLIIAPVARPERLAWKKTDNLHLVSIKSSEAARRAAASDDDDMD
jgi:hypothetical protein